MKTITFGTVRARDRLVWENYTWAFIQQAVSSLRRKSWTDVIYVCYGFILHQVLVLRSSVPERVGADKKDRN